MLATIYFTIIKLPAAPTRPKLLVPDFFRYFAEEVSYDVKNYSTMPMPMRLPYKPEVFLTFAITASFIAT